MSIASEAIIKQKANWLWDLGQSGDLLPYVYMRQENQIANPGRLHDQLGWFTQKPLFIEALSTQQLGFGEAILNLENQAFGVDLAMPRWVFYDCAIVPGFVCGFAMKASKLPDSYKKALGGNIEQFGPWIPLSLFIMIPSIHKGEWTAHNLCAINSLVPASERLYGLGFLTKAFGLWYANVETCVGMTQWGKPALKLHSHYGHLEVLTSYTPIHTYAGTLTYRCVVKPTVWELFFNRDEDFEFLENFEASGVMIDPKSTQSMQDLQARIENKEGPYFLSPREIADKDLTQTLTLYKSKGNR